MTSLHQPTAGTTLVTGATHRAAQLSAPRQWEIRDGSPPAPGDGEVLIRIEGCGICGSDIPVYEGCPWFEYPLGFGAPGHEGWGVVAGLGENVHELRVGDRVAGLTYRAFSTFDVARSEHCVQLPSEIAGRPFPGEPLACAWNVFERSQISSGQKVAIVGVGFLGALLVTLAAQAGARVTAFARRRFALEAAEQGGAERLELLATAAAEDGAYDCVVEAAGKAETLELASRLIRIRGRLVIAGYHQDGPRQVNLQEWNWKGIDVINAHERDPAAYVSGMRQAARAVADGIFDPSSLYTHQFELAEIRSAFEFACERPNGFMKALVMT